MQTDTTTVEESVKRERCINRNQFYTNALVLSNEGKMLCTLNNRRIEWYLNKGLAVEVPPPEGYPRAIQLNFKAKFDRDPEAYEIAIIKNQCVICGAEKELSLHHVVPSVIRRLFPIHEKGRSRQWCLLLCLDCHAEVEEKTQAEYKKDYPHGVTCSPERAQMTLRHMKSINMLHRLSPEKFQDFMDEAGYMTVEEIPGPPTAEDRNRQRNAISNVHQKAIREWGNKFIEEHGGIQGTKAYFRDLFLKCNPTYIPKGYLDL